MHKKIILVGVGVLLVVALAGALALWLAEPATFRGTSYEEPYPNASEFELTRSDGSRLRLSELRGNIVLVFFGFTTCPDVCPTTLAELNLALSKLPAEDAEQVKVIFITADPERDTPEIAQEYVSRFNPTFIGLSGEPEELEMTWFEYGVMRTIEQGQSAAGYLITHTARVTMIDRQGHLRVSFAFDTPVEDIVHDLKLILDQP